MSKRAFGNIRKLPSGRFQARYRAPDGQLHTGPRTFDTKREATRYLATVETDLTRGEWRDPRAGQITFGEWCDLYLASAVHKRATTLYQDRSVLECHLRPAFGDLPLARISPMHVMNFVTHLRDQNLKPSTIRSICVKLRTFLNGAVSADLIVRTPFRGVTLPRNDPTEIRTLSPKELHRLADAIATEYKPMVYLAGVLGLRFGEIAALRVKRLDLLHRRVQILETATQLGDFTEPKTPAARRTLTMPLFLSDLLAQHLQRRGLTAADGDDLVFVAPRGGRLHENNWHRRDWQPAIAASGLTGLTPHGLRHSAASTMIALGAHPKAIQERLGHTNITTTLNVYGHIFDQVDSNLTSLLEDHFTANEDGPSEYEAVHDV